MQRNINVAFLRGRKSQTAAGNNVYSLEDGFSVFDSTSNTPTYWKKAKYEMMAKLDNFGPFQFFFTLSCADKLWNENITAVLEEKKYRIRYEFDTVGNEKTLIGVQRGINFEWISLDQFIEKEMEESIHEILRRNVVTATRNYQHRVKAFIKEIMTDTSSPMLVKYYSAKLEFQGRGACHNHGTIWVDTNKMEFMMENENSDSPKIENRFEDFDSLFKEEEAEFKEEVKDALIISLKSVHPQTFKESQQSDKAKEVLRIFKREKLESSDSLDYCDVVSMFRFIGLNTAFKKFQTQEILLPYEESAIINFANTFTSVCLAPSV